MIKTATLAAGLLAFCVSLPIAGTPALAQPPNVAIQWNQVAQTQFGVAPSSSQRNLAILHIAMFDAINSIEEVYTPYRVHVQASHGASPEAAAAPQPHMMC